ncbi:hypothetical protein GX563_01525 [Candidatus Bathyarchaeota archaeon]|nr:hypothetical protein [Candidatus Bathyarchaeota archaeon]
MRGRIVLAICLLLSIGLLLYGVALGVEMGHEWFAEKSTDQWHMNNYFVIDAKYAYCIFGLATLAVGGLCTGLAVSTFLAHKKTVKCALLQVGSFFAAIVMSGLGFNTLNFMLGSFYWTNMQYPPPVAVPILGSVDVWNFYFFLFIIPLWAGGLFFGLAATHYAFVYTPHQKAVAVIAGKQQLILAESAVLTRECSPKEAPNQFLN